MKTQSYNYWHELLPKLLAKINDPKQLLEGKYLMIGQEIIGFDDTDFMSLVNGIKNSSVQYLCFNDPSIRMRDQDMKRIAVLSKIPTVKSMDLSYLISNTYGMSILISGLANSSIEKLGFGNEIQIDEGGIVTLFNGLKATSIKFLTFSFGWHNTPITTNGILALAQVLKHTSVEYLNINLNANLITNEGMKALTEGMIGSRVKEINLSGNSVAHQPAIRDEGVVYLAKVLKNTLIEILSITCNPITDVGIKALAEGLIGSSVKSLDISNIRIADEGLEALSLILKDTSIKKLHLGWMSDFITNYGLLALVDGLMGSAVDDITLWNHKVTEDVMKAFAQKLRYTAIEKMHFSSSDGSQITDIQIKAFAEGLVGSSVKDLTLHNHTITDDGLTTLTNVLKYTSIERLCLSSSFSQTSHEGLQALMEGMKYSSIQQIYVGNNQNVGIFHSVININKSLVPKIQKYINEDLSGRFKLINGAFYLNDKYNPVVEVKKLMLVLNEIGTNVLHSVFGAMYYKAEAKKLKDTLSESGVNELSSKFIEIQNSYETNKYFTQLKNWSYKSIGSKLHLGHNIMSIIIEFLDSKSLSSLIMSCTDNIGNKVQLFNEKNTQLLGDNSEGFINDKYDNFEF